MDAHAHAQRDIFGPVVSSEHLLPCTAAMMASWALAKATKNASPSALTSPPPCLANAIPSKPGVRVW
jgi:hypothetical protein